MTGRDVLVVDRPFLFFIRHDPTGALLFAGRVADPTRWDPDWDFEGSRFDRGDLGWRVPEVHASLT
jgi:hypothetical protein